MLSGRDYLNDYRALLPKEVGNVTVIELKELTDNKYIENVVDSNGDKCTARVVAKKISKNDYEYYACLSCPDYNSGGDEGEACKYDENNNITAETKNYKVVVDPDSYVIEQGEDFNLPYGKAYYMQNGDEKLVSDKVVGNPKTINTNKLGKTTVTYVYKGAKKEVTVEVVDTAKPDVPQVVLKYDDKNGKVYRGGWYSGDIYAEFKSTDYSKEGVTGSGIDNYQIKKADASDTEYVILKDKNNKNVNYYLYTENGEQSYYVRSVDKSRNISDSNTYSLKIDKVIPTCSLEVVNGTLGSNEWYISNVTVGFKETDGTVSDIFASNISIKDNSTNKSTITTSITTNGTFVVTGTVTDEAGNIGVCKLNVKEDKVKPTIVAKSAKNYITLGQSKNITDYFTIVFSPYSGTGTTVCKVGDTTVTNINQLEFGTNTITCTLTGVNGLTASASTVIAHQYAATAYCNGGRTLSGGNCTYYYSNNESQCGCGTWNTCSNSACGAKTCENAACGAKTCENAACGAKTCTTSACGQTCSCPPGFFEAPAFGNACGDGHGGAAPKTCKNNTCANAACGYYSCETSGCGYKSCATSGCGCKTANSCTKTENNYRYYRCEKTGNTGTTGSLSGSTCSF